MHGVFQDVRLATRTLLKRSGLTTVILLTLALGIGANTAIFSVLDAVLLRPLPYPNPDQLTLIWQTDLSGSLGQTTVSPPNFFDWRRETKSFVNMAAFLGESFNLTGRDEPERVRGTRVTANWFSVLDKVPLLGRTFHADEDQPGAVPVVVISHGLWKRCFGSDSAVLGQTVTLSGVPRRVVGIMPPDFALPRRSDLWIPYVFTEDELTQRGNVYVQVLGRLRPGVTLGAAQAEMDTIAKRLATAYPNTNAKSGVALVQLHDQMVQRARPVLIALLGAAGFVLLVACANVANLLLMRSAGRNREIAIRSALGAARSRLFSQLLIESVFLAVVGGTLGVILAFWGTDVLISLSPAGFPRIADAGVDGRVIGFALSVSLLTGLIFGTLPALQGSRCDVHTSLKEGGPRSSGTCSTRSLRQTLAVAEVAISFVLLVGTGLMVRSLVRLQSVDPGFDSEGAVATYIELPTSTYAKADRQAAFFTDVVERIEALPGVKSAASVTTLPMSGGNLVTTFTIEGRSPPPPGEALIAGYDSVTPHYFRTMRIPLVRGRVFTERDDRVAPKVTIINETMARVHWPEEDPLGKRVSVDGTAYEIVGIVGDVKHRSLSVDARSEMVFSLAQVPAFFGMLVVRTEHDPLVFASAIRNAVWSVDPDQTLGPMKTMEQYVAASTSRPRFTLLLIGVFAALALVLSAIGIYGVMSYSVDQRLHEIGVRAALGAGAADLAKMILSQGAVLVALGVGIGMVGAVGLTRLLSSVLFDVSPTDTATLFAVVILLASVGLLACFVPTYRASKVDPMIALRCE